MAALVIGPIKTPWTILPPPVGRDDRQRIATVLPSVARFLLLAQGIRQVHVQFLDIAGRYCGHLHRPHSVVRYNANGWAELLRVFDDFNPAREFLAENGQHRPLQLIATPFHLEEEGR